MPQHIYNKLKNAASQAVADMCKTHLEADIFMLNLNKALLYSLACNLKFDREMYHRDVCEFYEVHKFMFPEGIIHVNEFPEFSKNELKKKVRHFKRKNQVA